MLRRLAGTAGLFLFALTSFAVAQSYAQNANNIKAAIVVIDSAQSTLGAQPINYTPHVWYNLDSDKTVKPAGWNIYNPRANTQVSQAIYDRWNLLGFPPVLNSTITKAHAPYWEIRLSQVGEAQLSDYDILLLSAYGFTNLNSVERDKLRKFVDQGGVLWIDLASSTNVANSQVNTFPIPVQTRNVPGGAALTDADIFSPLMMTPYTLTLPNLEQIRTDRVSFAAPIDLAAIGLANYFPMLAWLELDYDYRFSTVASRSGTGPNLLHGRLGDGHVVVTTSGYAMALNRVTTGPGTYNLNTGYYGIQPVYDRTSQLAAKFAVNLVNLAAMSPQHGGGARKSGGVPIDSRPPMLRRTSAGITAGTIQKNQAPVVYKGLLVVSAGSQVKVYDAKPRSDQDGDGNPDDGIRDTSLGEDYDLLWESVPLGTQISSPTCAEIPGSAIRDQIFVVGANGSLFAFDAFFLTNGTINPGQTQANFAYRIDPPQPTTFNTAAPGAGPYAPTFHDGMLYISAVQSSPVTGFVWVVDPLTQDKVKTEGAADWYVGANNAQTLPEPSGSPTIGLIPVQDNSGGYDRVMYLPGRPSANNSAAGTASITSLWMGVRGESPPPNSLTFDPATLTVVTRAARQGLKIYLNTSATQNSAANRSLGVKLTVLHPNGDPFTNTEMQTYFSGKVDETSGILSFGLNTALPANVGIRLDYSIDWGTGNGLVTSQIIRGQLNFPDHFTPATARDDKRHIIGNIAMSPRGTLYCVLSSHFANRETSDTWDGGSFYAIREDIGRGGFRLLTRYNLYPRHTIPLNQATPVSYDETLSDMDHMLSMPGVPSFLSGRFRHLTFVSGPIVRDGVVYALAAGRKNNGGFSPFIPFSILMAFKAEPEAPEIRVGDIPDGFSLRQYDIDRSALHTAPNQPNDMTAGQFTYDRSQGVIRFDNLMTTNRSIMVNAFSTSQPVVVKRPNAPDTVLDPDSNGSKWSPLLWYAVSHGVRPVGNLVATGSSVFLPGESVVPNIADMIATGNIKFSGMIEAWNTNLPPTNRWLVGDTSLNNGRPWVRQLYQMLFTSQPDPNPNFLWPQMTDLRDFPDYIVRVRQTRLGKSTTAFGLATAEGVVAATGDEGVYAFTKSDFIIADEGRLGRFDANGNPLWVSTNTSSTGAVDESAVGSLKPLVRPTRAYPVGENDIIVADPGANRIARIDLAGRELRSITGFKLNETAIPAGFKANEPLTLNSPRDVVLFTSYEAGGTQYWIHYLIADTGNKRIIELVDKYNVNANRQITDAVVGPDGQREIGVLYWHSPENFSGKAYDYNSISRVYEPTIGRYYYAAGIGGTLPTRINTGLDSPASATSPARETNSGNGGVVVFDPLDPSKNLIINQVWVSDIPQDTFWNFTTGTFNSQARVGQYKQMTNVSSVTTRVISLGPNQPRIAIMFTDSTGVYEVYQPSAGSDWTVRWMLTNEAYRAIRRLPTGGPLASNAADLRATYARRLDDGDVLVVNGYLGKTRGDGSTPPRDFNGEVLQINGDIETTLPGFDWNKQNLGFDLTMIVFQLPPMKGARGLILPVFADRR